MTGRLSARIWRCKNERRAEARPRNGHHGAMSNPFTLLKERALQAAAKAFINREIKGFGVVTELAIDTSKKTMRVELDLIGEASRIMINVASYELSEKNGEIHIAVQNVTASREWITAVLNKYVVSRTFQLPNAARMLL